MSTRSRLKFWRCHGFSTVDRNFSHWIRENCWSDRFTTNIESIRSRRRTSQSPTMEKNDRYNTCSDAWPVSCSNFLLFVREQKGIKETGSVIIKKFNIHSSIIMLTTIVEFCFFNKKWHVESQRIIYWEWFVFFENFSMQKLYNNCH